MSVYTNACSILDKLEADDNLQKISAMFLSIFDSEIFFAFTGLLMRAEEEAEAASRQQLLCRADLKLDNLQGKLQADRGEPQSLYKSKRFGGTSCARRTSMSSARRCSSLCSRLNIAATALRSKS